MLCGGWLILGCHSVCARVTLEGSGRCWAFPTMRGELYHRYAGKSYQFYQNDLLSSLLQVATDGFIEYDENCDANNYRATLATWSIGGRLLIRNLMHTDICHVVVWLPLILSG